MARNLFQAMMGMPDDTGNQGKRDDETQEQHADRIKQERQQYKECLQETARKGQKGIDNYKKFMELRKNGVLKNGMDYDDYLRDKGETTDITIHSNHVDVGGKHMSFSEYEDWRMQHGDYDGIYE
jgi:hypothetical protein